MRLGAIALILAIAADATRGSEGAATASSWQLPDAALGARIAPILLLSRPDVRSDLEFDEEMTEAARLAILDLYARAASLRGTTGAEAVVARRDIDEAAERWLDDHLSVTQRSRLDQLDLQWEGIAALFTRPTLAASMGLSADQLAALGAIVMRRPGLLEQGRGPVEAHLEIGRSARAVLSENQRRRWESFVGPGLLDDRSSTAEAPSTTPAR